mgnify:CR=1 FL=1
MDEELVALTTNSTTHDIEHIYGEIFVNRIPGVEDIQDIVERNLMKLQKFEVAKHYILYRAKRQEAREEKKEKLEKQKKKIEKAKKAMEEAKKLKEDAEKKIQEGKDTTAWYREGALHREDGPAIIIDIPDEIRKKYQKENKKLHFNGCHWWINNQHHRDDGPASEYENGDKYWYKENMKHREDGPTVERTDGTEEWWALADK